MNKLERYIYDILKKNPAIKTNVRDLYQWLFDFVPVRKAWCKNPVTAREGFFFGFHDHTPFSADNKKLLANKYDIPLRMPLQGESLEIGYFSGSNWENYTKLQKTKAWNWHQGCKLQWCGSGNKCIYNDHIKGRNVAMICDVKSNTVSEIPKAISSVSGDGKFGVGYSFARVERFMPGYGYKYETDEPELDKSVTSKSGIYSVDLGNGIVKRLVSITDLVQTGYQKSMDGAFHFFSHALFSPTGRRFVFLHRWIKNDVRNRFSRLVSLDVEGKQLHLFPAKDMVSHLGWKNDKEILAYCRIGNRDAYYLFTDLTDSYQILGMHEFRSDGHPAFSPDERYILTDTYPDRTRRISLLKYDLKEQNLEKLAYLIHPRIYQSADPNKNWRCDLHPRWDRRGEYACFDSVHTGKRALCTMKV